MPIILSINAGSSSVKASLFTTTSTSQHEPSLLASAEASSITSPPAKLKYTRGTHSSKDETLPQDVNTQEAAFHEILKRFVEDDSLEELKHKDAVQYVCHRIVHGGEFGKVQVIDDKTFHYLEELSDLAPLHNTVGLQIVKATVKDLPKATNMAYFDSAFHTTIPKYISTYAIDQIKAKQNKLRKYGFHGISYAFILHAVAKYLGKDVKDTNLIALHLGSGASACAIRNGQSLDNSMGLTPVAGLPGGTRSGDIDPSLVFHYTHDAGKPSPSSTKEMHITQAEELLNKKSGFKSLTGTSDFGKISASSHESCKLAVDLFVDRVCGYVGSYYVKLGGKVDALVFAGGIGEKAVEFRERVVKECACIGFGVDAEKNKKPDDATVADIGSSDAKHRTLVCQTDEQYEMARGCIAEAESSG